MEEGRIIAISFLLSTLGLLLLLFISTTQEPTPLSAINPDDIGSRVYVKGEIQGLYQSNDGHLFFTLTEEQGQIKVVAFRDIAKDVACIEDGRNIALRGFVEEYRGEIEIIPSKAADILC